MAVSMSNLLKYGVVSKSKKACHEKNDMAQLDRIFVFLTPWRNRDDSHFLKNCDVATVKIASNHNEKSPRKLLRFLVI